MLGYTQKTTKDGKTMTNENTKRRFKSCAQGYQELVHAYAYAPLSESGKTSCDRMSYENGKVNSYSTCIAFKEYPQLDTINNDPILFISNTRHSNTTAKQKQLLARATSHWTHIYIDGFGYSGIEKSDITKTANAHVKDMRDAISNGTLTTKAQRDAFISMYQTVNKINELWEQNYTADLLELASVYNDLLNGEHAKHTKAAKERQAKERKAIKETLKDMLSKNTYSYNAAYAYEYGCINENERKTKTMLKTLLSQNDNFSVIWFEGDKLKTSQNINTVSKNEAITLMKLFVLGRLEVGGRVADRYSIKTVTPDYVTVGCHKISKENILELQKQLLIDALPVY